jgi:hypothetical protein
MLKTFGEKKKTCFLCGTESTHTGLISTASLGSTDLDSRPPEPERSSLSYWIHTCPSCGYCAPDLSEGDRAFEAVVRGDEYRNTLENPSIPRLAGQFLCWALLQESGKEYDKAGWGAIHAAWACDDAGAGQWAAKCRKRASELLVRAREMGQWFAEDAGLEEAILVDLLRRAGRFEEALKLCGERLNKEPEETVKVILLYQKALIGKSDDSRHTVAEALRQVQS